MDCLRIIGGARLRGSVAVQGSKNAALPIMAASILAAEPVALSGVPNLTDVDTLALVLGHLGLETKRGLDDCVRITTVDPQPVTAGRALVARMRASFCVLGPLLARRGRAVVALPGGCEIGPRPVELHLAGLAALGADVRIERGYAILSATRLRGASIDLLGPHGPSVTGTANVLMAAVLAHGTTVIRHAAAEPEIADLVGFLRMLGADIEGDGTGTLLVRGVRELGGGEYTIIPDRVEAGTLLLAAAITGSTIAVTGTRVQHLRAVVEALEATGQRVQISDDRMTITGAEIPRAAHLVAALIRACRLTCSRSSWPSSRGPKGIARSPIESFPRRWQHVSQLRRLGGHVARHGGRTLVRSAGRRYTAPKSPPATCEPARRSCWQDWLRRRNGRPPGESSRPGLRELSSQASQLGDHDRAHGRDAPMRLAEPSPVKAESCEAALA